VSASCYDTSAPLSIAQQAISPDLTTMGVTETRFLTLAQINQGLIVPKGAQHQAYVVFLTNAATADGTVPQLTISGNLQSDAPQPLRARATWLAATEDATAASRMASLVVQGTRGTTLRGSLPTLTPNNAAAMQLEARFRAHVARDVTPRIRRARATRASSAPMRRALDVAPPPAIGSTLTINVPDLASDCDHPVATTAVVKAISTHAIVLSDAASPAGGFDDTTFQAIADEFDTVIYPTVTDYFGTPSDFDGNGRILIYFTPFINKLSPLDPADGYIGGTFYAGDLTPKSVCAASNDGEIFYAMTPDPNGTVGQPFALDMVRATVRGVLGHEFVHMINAGGRITRGAPFESLWLDEGLAHLAEHIVGRAYLHMSQDAALSIEQLRSMDESARFAFFNGNIINAALYMMRPDTIGPIADPSHVETNAAARGAIWSLLQYAGDQFAHGDRRTLIRNLVASPDTGVTNLVEQVGVPLDTLLTHWHMTLAMASYGLGINPKFRYTSYLWWNIFSSLVRPDGNSGYPLAFAVLPDTGAPTPLHIAHTGAVFWGVVQSPTATRHVRITGIGTSVDPDLRIGIIRVN
jgi:hypothetical protein